jgi:hypothetical protein
MPPPPPAPTPLAAIAPGRGPVRVLALVLGAHGPTPYRPAGAAPNAPPSYYAHLTLADSSAPLGVPLKFFGAGVLPAAAALPPLAPILFTGLSATRDGALVWNASSALRSSADLAPPPSAALDALHAWAESPALAGLPAAARAGRVAPLLILPAPHPPPLQMTLRRTPAPPPPTTTTAAHAPPPPRRARHNSIAPRPRIRTSETLAGVTAAGACCLVTVEVLEARLPRPPSHRGLPYPTGASIQALITTPARTPPLRPPPPVYTHPILLQLRSTSAADAPPAWAAARGDAAARVLGGVDAACALADGKAAARAARTLADLVRERGPFDVLLAPSGGGGGAWLLEVVDFFV